MDYMGCAGAGEPRKQSQTSSVSMATPPIKGSCDGDKPRNQPGGAALPTSLKRIKMDGMWWVCVWGILGECGGPVSGGPG